MRTPILSFTLLFFGLGALGGFAWATRNPDSTLLKQAEGWPVVGPVVLVFRELYAEPGTLVVRGEDEEFWVRRPPAVHGPGGWGEDAEPGEVRSNLPPWEGPPSWVWAPAGTALHRQPTEGAAVLGRLDAISNLPRLERRGDWFRIWRFGTEVWVNLPDYREDGPPLGNDPEPVRPVVGRPTDPELLAVATGLLRAEARQERRWRDRTLHTDVEDGTLLALLGRVAEQTGPAHRARYGRPSKGGPGGTVVLYAREADYRALQARTEGIADLEIAGHASRGLVALYAEGRTRAEVASTLVHELVHLVNPRTIGPALPPWLEEGLASDLASSRIATDGALHPAELGGRLLQWPGRAELTGPKASLWDLARRHRQSAAGSSLRQVLARDWRDFVAEGTSHQSYGTAAFFVRWLLDDSARARVFRQFLADVSEGADPSAEALGRRLEEELGSDWAEVEADFRRWTVAKAAAFDPRRKPDR